MIAETSPKRGRLFWDEAEIGGGGDRTGLGGLRSTT